MTSKPEPIGENNPIPDISRESDVEASNAKPNVPPAPSVPTLPPTKPHCEVTCKTEKDWWDKWKPIVEIIGIALLTLYTAYTIKMYLANKEAADAAKLAAETSYAQLFAMKVGNQAAINAQQQIAQTALNASRDIARNDQRAWVGVVKSGIVGPKSIPLKAGSEARFGVVMTNSGKSPALKVKSIIIARPIGKNDKFVPWYPKQTENPSVSVIVPGDENTVATERAVLNQNTIDALHRGQAAWYIYGRIAYEDIFGKPHYTTFCVSLLLERESLLSENCENYNDAN